MSSVWCDECIGYLYTEKRGGVVCEFTKEKAEKIADRHFDEHGHTCQVVNDS